MSLNDTQRDDLRRYAESINGSEQSYGATILRLLDSHEVMLGLLKTTSEQADRFAAENSRLRSQPFYVVDAGDVGHGAGLTRQQELHDCDKVLVDTINHTAESNSELKARVAQLQADCDARLESMTKLSDAVATLRREKDAAYSERDMLVCALAKFAVALGWETWIGPHEQIISTEHPYVEWEPEWCNVIYVVTPHGQVSWHVHDSEVEWFSFLPRRETPGWDGHTSVEKYARLEKITLGYHETRQYVEFLLKKIEELQVTHDAAVVFVDTQESLRPSLDEFASLTFDLLKKTLQCSVTHTVGGTTSFCMKRRDHDDQHVGGNLDGEDVIWDDAGITTRRKAREITPDAVIQERLHKEYDRQMTVEAEAIRDEVYSMKDD